MPVFASQWARTLAVKSEVSERSRPTKKTLLPVMSSGTRRRQAFAQTGA